MLNLPETKDLSFTFPEGFSGYEGKDRAHEAGFDAFLTGKLFAGILKASISKPSLPTLVEESKASNSTESTHHEDEGISTVALRESELDNDRNMLHLMVSASDMNLGLVCCLVSQILIYQSVLLSQAGLTKTPSVMSFSWSLPPR